MAMSTTGEGLCLDFLLTNSAVTRPTAWFIGLHAGPSGANGASNELSGNGYGRQQQTFTRSGNVCTGVSDLTFGPDSTTNWGNVTDFSVWDAVTGGRCLWVGTLQQPVAYSVGDRATVAGSVQTFTLT